MKILIKELEKIWAIEEIKIRQRSRDRMILEGDRNTTYFHAVANHKYRKKRIEQIKGPSGMVQGTSEMLKVVVSFYKELLKYEDRGSFCLDNNLWDSEDMITREKLESLEASF
jgi:hypothetical protein